MKPDEICFRLHRKLKIIQEELGLHSNYKVPQESAQMEDCLLLGFEKDEERVREYFHSLFAEEVERLIQKAQHILAHRFDLLGYENLNFGDDIDWTYEPNRKKKIPLIHWSKISSMKLDQIGDLKIVWELNRHQHLITLGQAYFLTGDSRFAEEVVEQISDWQEKNPAQKGPNWASSLEVAFRLISWICTIRLIRGSEVCTGGFLEKIAVWIGEHARHIERFLSIYSSPNTHLTGEALGLFYAGVFFPNLPEAPRWQKKGKDILFKMLPIHLLQDGGYVERTLWYHQYTISFYLHFFILLRMLGEEIPDWAWERVEKGVSFLMYSLKPDGTIPMIGDDDGGFFLALSTRPMNDPRGLIGIGATLFKRGDFKAAAGVKVPEVVWALGCDGQEIYANLEEKQPAETSKGFKETGFFFFRSAWGEKGNYMAFDCGPHGWLNSGHAHADVLSFQVASGNTPVVEDPGTYLYVKENGWRDFFRGPKAHATVWLDEKHPAIPRGNFHWFRIPPHQLYRFYTGPRYDYVSGSMMIDENSEVLREVYFIKPDLFLIIDTLKGEGLKKVEVRFPLSVAKWSLFNCGCRREGMQNPFVIIFLEEEGLTAHLEPSWISGVYGKKESSNTLVLKGDIVLPSRKAYLIDLSGRQRLGKPSFILRDHSFKLTIEEECWVGFGRAGSKESINNEEIETDYDAGLLKYLLSGEMEILGVYEGSYLYYQGRQFKVA
jgi:hypothetical protein